MNANGSLIDPIWNLTWQLKTTWKGNPGKRILTILADVNFLLFDWLIQHLKHNWRPLKSSTFIFSGFPFHVVNIWLNVRPVYISLKNVFSVSLRFVNICRLETEKSKFYESMPNSKKTITETLFCTISITNLTKYDINWRIERWFQICNYFF